MVTDSFRCVRACVCVSLCSDHCRRDLSSEKAKKEGEMTRAADWRERERADVLARALGQLKWWWRCRGVVISAEGVGYEGEKQYS